MSHMARGDFNGDGFEDLAIGVPGENNGAGAVNVLYSIGGEGGDVGLTDEGNQRWDQGSGTVVGTAEAGDQFGAALAAGDFNGGADDLVIGVPGENNGAGAVNVLLGSPDGLTDTDNFRLDLDRVAGESQAGDQFGAALAIGDFNNDSLADLVIGVPGRDDGNIVDAGEAYVLDGTVGAGGVLRWSIPDSRLSQAILEGAPNAGDRFGSALAVGNFNGDAVQFSDVEFAGPIDDLAIGVPGEDGGRGAVNVVYGMDFGLAAAGNQLWDQDTGTVEGAAEAGDQFGAALAVGNFNGDNAEASQALIDDLAIGVPGEDENAGAVNVLFGSENGGLTDTDNKRWDQDTGTVEGTAEAGDQFGAALTAGLFGTSGELVDSLAIGVPGEDENAGAVNVLFGSKNVGLTDTDNKRWDQDTGTVEGTAEAGDQFGAALAAGNFIGEFLLEDLAIGVPGEDNGAGAVNMLQSDAGAIIPGVPLGLTDFGNERWDQDTGTVMGTAEAGDRFGSALTGGDALFLI